MNTSRLRYLTLKIGNFLEEVTHPVLRDVSIDYAKEEVEDLTRNKFSVFLQGSELAVAGRVKRDTEDFLDGDRDLDDQNLKQNIIQARVMGSSFENDIEVDFDIDVDDPSSINEAPHHVFYIILK